MSQHTPGPWIVDIDGRNIIGQGNGYPVVAKAKRDEDVHLIAAAPEMLEAMQGDPECPEISPLSWLKSAIDELRERGPAEDCDDPDAFWMMVREIEDLHRKGTAAIAKAEGLSN